MKKVDNKNIKMERVNHICRKMRYSEKNTLYNSIQVWHLGWKGNYFRKLWFTNSHSRRNKNCKCVNFLWTDTPIKKYYILDILYANIIKSWRIFQCYLNYSKEE
jgi:hypothetical protein